MFVFGPFLRIIFKNSIEKMVSYPLVRIWVQKWTWLDCVILLWQNVGFIVGRGHVFVEGETKVITNTYCGGGNLKISEIVEQFLGKKSLDLAISVFVVPSNKF